MNTNTTHISNFGSFAPRGASIDREGYIHYHDSDRYAEASDTQLEQWLALGSAIVRNAAAIEMAERALNAWRDA